ncbi:MAG: hypothetical protein AVO38_10635 [delta proteobacterium ML8_D]|nr:MAG: hypothetical protein AVO38_10635 [delta proteobacterium ML8_D]
MKDWGKSHLERISREDLAKFVEYEQDRGSKPSTVRMRLGCVKAFMRFLMKGGGVDLDVLSKRMAIKVPDSLPRAMEREDEEKVLQSNGVIDRIINRLNCITFFHLAAVSQVIDGVPWCMRSGMDMLILFTEGHLCLWASLDLDTD